MKEKHNHLSLNGIYAEIGISLLFGIFPLFFTKRYTNITVSKAAFFCCVSFAFFVLCYFTAKSVKRKKIRELKLKDIDFCEAFILLFFLACILSTMVSPYPISSITGSDGRYMGTLMMLAICCCYYFAAKCFVMKERVFVILAAAVILFALVALVQGFGFDIFNMIADAPEGEKYKYISTIGNVNIAAAFVSVTAPVSAALFCLRKKTNVFCIIYAVAFVLDIVVLLMCNSDSGYLGIIVGLWLVGFFALKDYRCLARFFVVCSAFFAAVFIYGAVRSAGIIDWIISDTTDILVKQFHPCVLAAVFAASAFGIAKAKPRKGFLHITKIIYVGVTCLVAAALVCAVVYFTFINRECELNDFLKYFRIDKDWGTGRGGMWKLILSVYKQIPIKNKLFGYGSDTLLLAMEAYVKDDMLQRGLLIDNAHNEYLQYLLTTGIFGLTVYMALITSAFITAIKKREKDFVYYAVAAAILSYCAQATVNLSQALTTPLLFVFIALSANNSAERVSTAKTPKGKAGKRNK